MGAEPGTGLGPEEPTEPDQQTACSAFGLPPSWFSWRWFWVFPHSLTETRTSTRTRTWSWSCVTTGCFNELAAPAFCRRTGVNVQWRSYWLRCLFQRPTPSERLRWFPWQQEEG